MSDGLKSIANHFSMSVASRGYIYRMAQYRPDIHQN